MGNITAVIRKRQSGDGSRQHVVDLTFSSSYATNGDSLPSNAALGLDASLDHVDVGGCTSGGYVVAVDVPNRKLKLFRQTAATSALVEVPNTTNVSAETVRAVVYGDMPNA